MPGKVNMPALALAMKFGKQLISLTSCDIYDLPGQT